MSLTPAFEIGLWNAWILSAIFLTANYLIMFISPKENVKEMMDQVKQAQGKDKQLTYISWIPYLSIVFCSIFVPLKLGTLGFYFGLALFTSGMIALIVAAVQLFFRKRGQLMTEGFYRFSRNPIYVSCYIAWTGIAVATASWVILVLVVLSVIVQHFLILGEERICMEKYGASYREYMNTVPRYLLVFNEGGKSAERG